MCTSIIPKLNLLTSLMFWALVAMAISHPLTNYWGELNEENRNYDVDEYYYYDQTGPSSVRWQSGFGFGMAVSMFYGVVAAPLSIVVACQLCGRSRTMRKNTIKKAEFLDPSFTSKKYMQFELVAQCYRVSGESYTTVTETGKEITKVDPHDSEGCAVETITKTDKVPIPIIAVQDNSDFSPIINNRKRMLEVTCIEVVTKSSDVERIINREKERLMKKHATENHVRFLENPPTSNTEEVILTDDGNIPEIINILLNYKLITVSGFLIISAPLKLLVDIYLGKTSVVLKKNIS